MEKEAKNIMGDNPTITYFDADLFKQIAGGTKEQLHEPGIDIKVTIQIPNDLLNHDRTMDREYKIIRLHNGEVSVLSGEFDEATKEFTFATDKFSTYAIAYSDTKIATRDTQTPDNSTDDNGNDNDNNNNNLKSPKTGDDSNPTLWFSLLLMSLAGLFVRKKKLESC